MTDEEMRQTMEFILERQQQFADDILLLRESQAEFQEQVKQFQEQVRQAHAGYDMRLARLAEATLTTFGKLTEAQKATEERLNIFIAVVERHLGGKQNGESQT